MPEPSDDFDFFESQFPRPLHDEVPRAFALVIDYGVAERDVLVRASDVVAIGIQAGGDVLLRVRNPFTGKVDDFPRFPSAEMARAALSAVGGGALRLLWAAPLVS